MDAAKMVYKNDSVADVGRGIFGAVIYAAAGTTGAIVAFLSNNLLTALWILYTISESAGENTLTQHGMKALNVAGKGAEIIGSANPAVKAATNLAFGVPGSFLKSGVHLANATKLVYEGRHGEAGQEVVSAAFNGAAGFAGPLAAPLADPLAELVRSRFAEKPVSGPMRFINKCGAIAQHVLDMFKGQKERIVQKVRAVIGKLEKK